MVPGGGEGVVQHCLNLPESSEIIRDEIQKRDEILLAYDLAPNFTPTSHLNNMNIQHWVVGYVNNKVQ